MGGGELHCPACKRDTLLLREACYEGFTRVGESLRCAGCGHEFASEDEVPFKGKTVVRLFTEADRSHDPNVFAGDEARFCLHCRHYVVNPFTQWCGVHRKEVVATDGCDHFERKAPPEDEKLPATALQAGDEAAGERAGATNTAMREDEP